MIKMLRDKIGGMLYKENHQEKLLDTIYASVLMVENDYNNAVTSAKNKTKETHFLTSLIDISTKLIRYRFDNEKLGISISNLMRLLDVNIVYISKFKDDVFRKVLMWNENGKYKCTCKDEKGVLTREEAPLLFDSITQDGRFIRNGKNFSEADQCLTDDNGQMGECIFPITIGERMWGILGFIRHGEDCNWSDEHINICNILSSIFSSHIKTYKLIDDLKQGAALVDITNRMIKLNTWSKDEFGKFTYCSPSWKKLFFGLEEDVDVTGKTNIELIEDFIKRTGKKHTYVNVCKNSDLHCMTQNKTCYYLEIGYINSEPLVLDMKKSPIYFDGRCRGVVGVARDISTGIDGVAKLLSSYIDKGVAENLNPDYHDSDIATYWIKTEEIYNTVIEEVVSL